MGRHKANASPEYHANMALHYLYHAVRSLAAVDGELAAFKQWEKDHQVSEAIGPASVIANQELFLAALCSYHNHRDWPWRAKDWS